MPLENTTTILLDEPQISETEDTPNGSSGVRRLPTALACLLATTPVGALSPYDLFAREYIVPNTISTEEESHLVSLGVGRNIDEMARQEVFQPSEADTANRIRLDLLAREYVNKHLSPEEEARLSIVTQRVRRLIPRVTIEDFEALERIAERLQRIGSDDADRRRRLGIA